MMRAARGAGPDAFPQAQRGVSVAARRTQFARRIPTVRHYELGTVTLGLVLQLAPEFIKADVANRTR